MIHRRLISFKIKEGERHKLNNECDNNGNMYICQDASNKQIWYNE